MTAQAIGIGLSKKLGMRVFEDNCFLKMLQDAWLQEHSDVKTLKELLGSRGRGPTTCARMLPL